MCTNFASGMLPGRCRYSAVIMQEDTERNRQFFLQLKVKPTQGEYIRHKGEFI
jgi:molybdopterin biosynthesis enzyme